MNSGSIGDNIVKVGIIGGGVMGITLGYFLSQQRVEVEIFDASSVLGGLAGIAPIQDYLTDPNHYVHHVPLAILASGLVILGFGSIFLGVLLHAVNVRFKELHNVLVRRR